MLVYPPLADTPRLVPALDAVHRAAGWPPATEEGDGDGEERRVPDDFPAVYVVASTNDRIVPPETHADPLVDGLRACGVRCTYQRQRLGSHGFGVTRRWTQPCATWLQRELGLPHAADDAELEPPLG